MKNIVKLLFGLNPEIYEKLSERLRHYYKMKVIAWIFSLLISATFVYEIGVTAFKFESTLALTTWCLSYMCIVGLLDILICKIGRRLYT